MSTYVHRIVQVKVSQKWETIKIYADYSKRKHYFYDDEDKSAKEKEFEYVVSLPITLQNTMYLEDINNYCDNLIGLREDLYNRFRSQTWDDTYLGKKEYHYNHCWATLSQLESWESELTNKFFNEMKDVYRDSKLDEILSILKKLKFNPTNDYFDKTDEIKENYFYDILSLDSMIHTAYAIASQAYDIYNTDNIRILFYYE